MSFVDHALRVATLVVVDKGELGRRSAQDTVNAIRRLRLHAALTAPDANPTESFA